MLTLSEVTSLITKTMDEILPRSGYRMDGYDILLNAIRYSSLSPGKRLRGALVVAAASLFDVDLSYSLRAASAIEFIHTYSLIHDDLPAMDNDDYRRGQLSCHKKHGEAIAILAGDGLLSYAFQILSDVQTHPDPIKRLKMIQLITQAIGLDGMVGGQALDIMPRTVQPDIEDIIRLQRLKTANLFTAACSIGATLGFASTESQDALHTYSSKLGLAFQIRDDIYDFSEVDIYDVSSNNIVSIIGGKRALTTTRELLIQAVESLNIFAAKALLLKDIADYLLLTLNEFVKSSGFPGNRVDVNFSDEHSCL